MVSQDEIKLYLKRSREALQQSRDNIGLNYYDVAISRAYYAMFYAAVAALGSQGISPKKHAGVHSTFALHLVKPGLIEPQYSKMLGNAFRLRLDSDYKVIVSFDKDLAENLLQDAEYFVERMDTYLRSGGYL